MERVQDLEQWEMMLTSPLPNQTGKAAVITPATAEEEGAGFLAAMATLKG